ncbi:uncharacterized protein DUF4241 [Chitinophaga skermanii]|uniref:Uncharacterized protein DUF4241 n=1 Tax=Chitinophaga skermanii TaxID=331697 RepID=A0A327R3L5_9BACT|nr:DUF4241 domain-containing protein [Chitinophaga skermanii]RAJ10552.1 uncharacterized protein DUF4241 [Chitinophaga skermanii]
MSNIKYPAYLEDAFVTGYKQTDEDGDVFEFYNQPVGDLNIHDGKIIACDAFTFYGDDPFTDNFPKGKFPVELAIAKISANEDERTGFARIKFSNEAPVKWEFALIEGQDRSEVENGTMFGYGVDSGTGSFMDLSGHEAYTAAYDEDEKYYEKVVEQLDENFEDTRSWLLWQKKNQNVAIFSTGWGDGIYQSYVGFDTNGNICRLVTDFGLLDWPE